jgi:hypothetical protein
MFVLEETEIFGLAETVAANDVAPENVPLLTDAALKPLAAPAGIPVKVMVLFDTGTLPPATTENQC